MHELAERIQQKDLRALARGITWMENDHPDKLQLLSDLYATRKNAHYIGITGSPGAGKSSLVNRMIAYLRKQDLTVAVIAVDPTSPFSGGALLGDRVRMNEHFTDPGVYIRSMATRGSLGGLSRATKDSLRVCDAFGFDVILVETVGVGQSELDIMKIVDTTAVVLTPNSGDVLQIFKAGIMEIADLFVVNKADLPGVRKLKTQLEEFLLISHSNDWYPPIVETVSTENKGMEQFWQHLKEHEHFLHDTAQGDKRRKQQFVYEVYDVIREELWQSVKHFIESDSDKIKSITHAEEDPYSTAKHLLTQWKLKGGHDR
ncbi:methylmalonyl Co-A mutase-associated GTPase MeaB [Pontibacillus litoralis]|uniref:Transporter n=1 Tax=Pontibacillus litoralis JSM 072002 TaxID=1385512 RepID=A0A0A5G5V5_9BACI|nr:methylmalonyl Co-A mutase-associated GTPase MeaB [Pontibacillus litoralis]KGX86475.1 transporter [Pontibacillus litoralis JSM 072002]